MTAVIKGKNRLVDSICLKCRKKFKSSDPKYNRLCNTCASNADVQQHGAVWNLGIMHVAEEWSDYFARDMGRD